MTLTKDHVESRASAISLPGQAFIDRALHMTHRLPCGTVSVNGFSEGDTKTPFGGNQQSISPSRDNGTEAMEQYLQTKTIWISQDTVA